MMTSRMTLNAVLPCCLLLLSNLTMESDTKQVNEQFSVDALAEQWAEKIQQPIQQSVQLGQEAADWQQQKMHALSEQQQSLGELYWTEYQLQKKQKNLQSLQAEVVQLQQDIDTINVLKQQLEPQLEVWYAMLEQQVFSDLPFDFDERKRRLAFLRSAMDKSELPLAERFRRLLEVISIEVAYGYGQQVNQDVIVIDEKPMQVNLLLLGRLAWFYMTPDEQQFGWFDRKTRQWNSIPINEQGDLRLAMAITMNKQIAEIVNVPLGVQR
ncbi:DUF3450 domain-containing protein [Shewanella algicola]|uniref:DUF3450 domain-containing protein n=1 Tax=Shewanella algicola TaxID=640633 RepID=A0A9X1ZC40_9GAMM|nr:DUF3450 family protein [Shewanella algicola]MCL1105770.1 DUF3450 domain-containing protein [Shewanella algicola]GGP55106.1 DUF3450 domain-containing protein [Shewanella algicola]